MHRSCTIGPLKGILEIRIPISRSQDPLLVALSQPGMETMAWKGQDQEVLAPICKVGLVFVVLDGVLVLTCFFIV